MKVLNIGMDRKLFEEGSAVLSRSKDYSSKMEELHIIVFSLKKHNLFPKKINNLYLYPTNSITRIGFLLDAYMLGKKVIRENKFIRGNSVISAQDPMGIIGYFLSKKFKFPLQLQIHTDIFSPYFKNSFLNYIHVVLANFLIPKADGLRVVSSVISDSINSKFPNLKARIDILPVFIDIEKIINFQPTKDLHQNFPQFNLLILAASRFTKEKRIDSALKAMQKVVAKFPYAGLVIAGEGSERKNLEKQSEKFGLDKNTIFIGWQSDLISFYKTADLFLLTSEYEGYGMTLIEAGTAGCPIVTTKVGVAKTGLFKDGENSYVCPVGDISCLSNHIVELASNPEKRNLFKNKMRDSIKNMFVSKEEYISRYIAMLENLL